jgi:hypothetical protein
MIRTYEKCKQNFGQAALRWGGLVQNWLKWLTFVNTVINLCSF